jgi:competence ComEA-like helix-hairpin-helix protein
MLNRQERVAVLLLSGALLVGTAASVLDYYDPSRLEEFSVLPGAVPVPAPMVDRSSVEALPLAELGPVAINSATARELERLPAIGPKTAARIVEYRDAHGPFATVDALQNVTGIGPRTLDKLRSAAVLDRRPGSPQQGD